jgi:hypothetical protein
MRSSKWALVLALVVAVPLTAYAGVSKAKDQSVTAGDFAVLLAAATGKGRDLSAEAAVESLRKAGVPIGDVKAVLNEKDLAAILDHYGVRTVTKDPGRVVSVGRAESALLAAGTQLASSATAAPGPDQSALDICLVEPNHGQCVNCCKGLGGKPTDCAKFCFAINKTSPSEPLP